MKTIRELVLAGTIIGLGMLLGAGIYESLVNVPNFVKGQETLDHARQFWSAANPGNYFRIVAPATQVLALLSLILSWKRPAGRRGLLLAAFLLVVAADVITFTYHYPRNALLFSDPMSQSPETLERAAGEWGTMNWARNVLCFAAISAALTAHARREQENQ
ncbi:MAG: hypothetical protein QOH06_5976 [Acidobacteriota bacterium]|jgi:hypothetical protein|nr:hypothetical protein [Acidobacteriota bacterium]